MSLVVCGLVIIVFIAVRKHTLASSVLSFFIVIFLDVTLNSGIICTSSFLRHHHDPIKCQTEHSSDC